MPVAFGVRNREGNSMVILYFRESNYLPNSSDDFWTCHDRNSCEETIKLTAKRSLEKPIEVVS